MEKEHRRNDRSDFYLDCDGGFMRVYSCQILSNYCLFFVFEVVCINICCTLAKFKGKKLWRTTRNLNELNSKVNRQEASGEMRPALFSSQKKW